MIGDGLNDAPALAAAHASLSPASAADISQRAADFVFQGMRLAPVLEALSTAKRARNFAPEFRCRLLLQFRGGAVCHGGLRHAADRGNRDVDLVHPRYAERGAACRRTEIMTALAWLIPAALLLGALELLAFLWALRSGQFEDLEGAAYRALEDDPPEDPAGEANAL